MTNSIKKEQRGRAIESIKQYFAEHLEDDIGELKAGFLLDFFLEEIAPSVYNQAVADAQAYFQDKLADLDGVCFQPEFGFWKSGR